MGGNWERGKGWTTHYCPRNPPLSVELEMVFSFLGLKTFASCPNFDFEPCFWSGVTYEKQGDSFFDRNTQIAHQWFLRITPKIFRQA
jgi:hypothetical protein